MPEARYNTALVNAARSGDIAGMEELLASPNDLTEIEELVYRVYEFGGSVEGNGQAFMLDSSFEETKKDYRRQFIDMLVKIEKINEEKAAQLRKDFGLMPSADSSVSSGSLDVHIGLPVVPQRVAHPMTSLNNSSLGSDAPLQRVPSLGDSDHATHPAHSAFQRRSEAVGHRPANNLPHSGLTRRDSLPLAQPSPDSQETSVPKRRREKTAKPDVPVRGKQSKTAALFSTPASAAAKAISSASPARTKSCSALPGGGKIAAAISENLAAGAGASSPPKPTINYNNDFPSIE